MRLIPIILVLTLAASTAARAAHVDDLYRAQTVVTGTVEPERTRGFRIGLADVIVKLTGDPRLAHSDVLAPLLADPHRFVTGFEYEDRMKGIPLHDEQGTRERPYDLRMTFDATLLNAALSKLGLRHWAADRPRVAVWLGVRTAIGDFVLRRTGTDGYGQRWALTDTAKRRGIPIWLPPGDGGGAAAIDYEAVSSDDLGAVRRASAATDAEAFLIGTLSVTPAGYWDCRWALHWRNRTESWERRGVTFDTAIRDGIDRSALIFTGRI